MNKLIKNTSIYTVGNVLPQLVGFLLLPLYTKYLTPQDFGIVSTLQVFSTILTILFTLSIDRSIYKLFFEYKDELSKRKFLGTVFITLVILSTLLVLLIFRSKNLVGLFLKSIPFYPYISIIVLTTFFAIYQIIPKIYFQITDKPLKFLLISLLQFVLTTGITIWNLIYKNEGAIGMLNGGLYANIIILPFVLIITFKIIKLSFKLSYLKDSMRFSLPLIPGLLSALVLNMSDRIFIERYFSLEDVGLYSIAYKYSTIITIIGGAFQMAFSPYFFKISNGEVVEFAKYKLQRSLYSYFYLMISLAFILAFFGKEVFYYFLDPKYIDSYKIIPILVLSQLLIQLASVYNLMIYQGRKNFSLMIVSLIGALCALILNLILIPKFSMLGASYSTLISFVIIAIMTIVVAKRSYYIYINWKRMIFVIILLSIIIILVQFLYLNILLMLMLKILIVISIIFFLIKSNRKLYLNVKQFLTNHGK